MRGWSENGFTGAYEGSPDGKGGRFAIVLLLVEGIREKGWGFDERNERETKLI